MRVLRAIKDRLSGSGSDSYRWTIITSAPKGEAGEQWGDTWFARDIAAALRRHGQQVSVVPRSGANQPPRSNDDVVVVANIPTVGTKERKGRDWNNNKILRINRSRFEVFKATWQKL